LKKVKTKDNINHPGVLACQSCGIQWQWDIVLAKNMLWIAQPS
jgi:hypothetical protein